MGREDFVIEKGMLDLFRVELEEQSQVLNNGVVSLEQGKESPELLESLMRAAHSIKGAARVVGLDGIVLLAHAMEDYFVALQDGSISFAKEHADSVFKAVDVFAQLKEVPHEAVIEWMNQEQARFEALKDNFDRIIKGEAPAQEPKSIPETETQSKQLISMVKSSTRQKEQEKIESETQHRKQERVLRVTAQNLSRLMGLAGESMVESRWLVPFSKKLMHIKKSQSQLSSQIDRLKDAVKEVNQDVKIEKQMLSLQEQSTHCLKSLSERLSELDLFISRHSSLTDRLYSEVIDSRMRPFSDGVSGFPRMVRDLAKQLGKEAHLVINGMNTPVDRDILDKLESPLTHLIRNSIDHGIETPQEREQKGKPREGTITLTAEHRGGMLAISVADDGRGVDIESLRSQVIESNLARGELAEGLNKQELLDFLFLPGFSTAKKVTELSGRGMGLNIVQNMLQEVSGSMRVQEDMGEGISFHMSLPLTLSVIRALTVEIAGEPYAFPLARIDRSLLVPMEQIEQIENRQYFNFEGTNIGLVPACQVLEVDSSNPDFNILPIVVVRDRHNSYGLVVDCFLGERELVIQDIEARLGKVPNISAGAFMEDGAPVLIIDVDDIISSIDNLLRGGRLHQVRYHEEEEVEIKKKRILVVDDSITVREVESRLLRNHGYLVETAVNGMDAWNAVRMAEYDLVITDIDMPRMNGIELVRMIKKDVRLKNLPIMIVSYKEREQDRILGMEAGADYYMTKSSFHDETLLEAVKDLI